MNYTNTKQTKEYLKVIENYLIEKYGEVKPEWYTVLQLLGDNLDLYKECKRSIKTNGIYDIQSGKKNPLLITLKDLQIQILKEVQHLGISPYAASKIKESVEEDSEDDFIDSLTDGDK